MKTDISIGRQLARAMLSAGLLSIIPACYVGESSDLFDRDDDGVADGLDCNPGIKDGLAGTLVYRDADADGHGDGDEVVLKCSAEMPAGYVDEPGDCDDRDAAVPSGREVCDGKDNDCNGEADDGLFVDGDGDGVGYEAKAGIGCDRAVFVRLSGDCDDDDKLSYPGAEEICDYRDNDCAHGTAADEGLTTDYYVDEDGDGYGGGDPFPGCEQPKDHVTEGGDCDDGDALVYPSAYERVDGVDGNCDEVEDPIYAWAGDGQPGMEGDGGAAHEAQLHSPVAVAIAGENVYLADMNNPRLRVVGPDGIIRCVAGAGGEDSEECLAKEAEIGVIYGLAVNGDTLYLAEASHRVRALDLETWMLTDVAGTGTAGNSEGSDPRTTQLHTPRGLAVAAGTLYIADSGNNCVRAISPDGDTITTVAGVCDPDAAVEGEPDLLHLNSPWGVVVHPDMGLLIADTFNNRIVGITPLGEIAPVAGLEQGYQGDGGEATDARLNRPTAIAVSPDDDLYISDSNNNVIRRVCNGIITTVAGPGTSEALGDAGPATRASLAMPLGVAVDEAGSLYIADTNHHQVRVVIP